MPKLLRGVLSESFPFKIDLESVVEGYSFLPLRQDTYAHRQHDSSGLNRLDCVPTSD